MFRWVRRTIVVVALVVVVGGGLLVLTARGDLNRTQDTVDTHWTALRPALETRYQLLSNAADASKNDAVTRPLAVQTAAALQTWRTDAHASVATQVTDANNLEAFGRRLATTVGASARLQGNAAIAQPVNAFTAAPVPAAAAPFNRAVHSYENARGGPLRRPVVSLFGYDSIPAVDLSGPSSS
jgi:hypothetical protein